MAEIKFSEGVGDLLKIPSRKGLGRILNRARTIPFIGGAATKTLRVGRKKFIEQIKGPQRSELIREVLEHQNARHFCKVLEQWARQPSQPVGTPIYPARPESSRCSVIINTVDRASDLVKTLEDLSGEWDFDRDELLIVLGPTTDQSEQIIRDSPVPCELIHCPVRNLAVSRNLGLRAARGRFVAFIDDDASPASGWLNALLSPLENDSKVGVSAGFVRDGHGKAFLNQYVVADTLGRAFWLNDPAEAQAVIDKFRSDRAFMTATGCNMAFRRSALDSIGGFDPFYQYFLEETDAVRRLLDSGFRCEVSPASQVWHRLGSNLARRPAANIQSRTVIARSQIHYIGKFGKGTYSSSEIESCLWERVLLDLEKIAWDCSVGNFPDGECGELQYQYLSAVAAELRLDLTPDSSGLPNVSGV